MVFSAGYHYMEKWACMLIHKAQLDSIPLPLTASNLDFAALSLTHLNEFFDKLQGLGGESHHIPCPVTSKACIQVSLETSVLTHHSKCNIATFIVPS